jgi:hypothetical protein
VVQCASWVSTRDGLSCRGLPELRRRCPVFATRHAAAHDVPLAIKDMIRSLTSRSGNQRGDAGLNTSGTSAAIASHSAASQAIQGPTYPPQFADFCAMALSLGEVVEADPENWLIADGKLYVFGKPTGPALFGRTSPATPQGAEQQNAPPAALTRRSAGGARGPQRRE